LKYLEYAKSELIICGDTNINNKFKRTTARTVEYLQCTTSHRVPQLE
jgi:hypothetical protein